MGALHGVDSHFDLIPPPHPHWSEPLAQDRHGRFGTNIGRLRLLLPTLGWRDPVGGTLLAPEELVSLDLMETTQHIGVVRQSSAHHVLHNPESSALQYAMRDRLTALGWFRIETVDDDLERPAKGEPRRGSERAVPRAWGV